MGGAPPPVAVTAPAPPSDLFPLVRYASWRLTPWLARTSLTPNHITFASLLAGLGAAAAIAMGGYLPTLAGALLLVLSYVLDNCDGEIARLKSLSSELGMVFDSATDWVVHAAFFAALGWGTWATTGRSWWLWLAASAVLGTTVNSAISIPREVRTARAAGAPAGPAAPGTGPRPGAGWCEHLVFFLRELSRADFCFLVVALALVDAPWLLLPAGAVGAHLYWVLGLVKGAERYHV